MSEHARNDPSSAPAISRRWTPRRTLLALAAALVAVFLGLRLYVRGVADDLLDARQLSQLNPEIERARAREQAALEGYARVDAAAGLYRIPVEHAIELLLKNPDLIRPLVAPASQPATQPAPGSPSSASQPATQPAPAGGSSTGQPTRSAPETAAPPAVERPPGPGGARR